MTISELMNALIQAVDCDRIKPEAKIFVGIETQTGYFAEKIKEVTTDKKGNIVLK